MISIVIVMILAMAFVYTQYGSVKDQDTSGDIKEKMTTRSSTSAQNIQMNLGSGKIISTEGSITNLDISDTINIRSYDGLTFFNKTFKVVTPVAWYVKLQSKTNGAQPYDVRDINKLIEQGEFFVKVGEKVEGAKTHMPVALYTPPNFRVNDMYKLVDMQGFEGTGRNIIHQNKAHLGGEIWRGSSNPNFVGFTINRDDRVDGSGFWTVQLQTKSPGRGKVLILD